MIPKIIHYCWFGRGELPELAKRCIATWHQFMPDYQFILWNEENFGVEALAYTANAYKERKYAFVADVCRLQALKEIGGLYLDTDVEFIKPLPPVFLDKIAFTGFEDNLVAAGVLGSVKNGDWVNDMLKIYQDASFYLPNGALDLNPITEKITSSLVNDKGLILDNSLQHLEQYVTVYPRTFFYPKSWQTLKTECTDDTICIHHFAASWIDKKSSFLGKALNLILGRKLTHTLWLYLKGKKG